MKIPESAIIKNVSKEWQRPVSGCWYVTVTYAWKSRGIKYQHTKEHRFKTEAAAVKYRQRLES
jgi:hypothetical protein